MDCECAVADLCVWFSSATSVAYNERVYRPQNRDEWNTALERGERLGELFAPLFASYGHKAEFAQLAVIHGDFYTNNILWLNDRASSCDGGEDGRGKVAAAGPLGVVDYQFCSWALPETDLGCLLVSSVAPEVSVCGIVYTCAYCVLLLACLMGGTPCNLN